jgi:hypothetical protein
MELKNIIHTTLPSNLRHFIFIMDIEIKADRDIIIMPIRVTFVKEIIVMAVSKDLQR